MKYIASMLTCLGLMAVYLGVLWIIRDHPDMDTHTFTVAIVAGAFAVFFTCRDIMDKANEDVTDG